VEVITPRGWFLHFRNAGAAATPRLSAVLPANITFQPGLGPFEVGLKRVRSLIVALYHHSSTAYQIHSDIRYLYF